MEAANLPIETAVPAPPAAVSSPSDLESLRAAFIQLSRIQGEGAKRARETALALEKAQARIDALVKDVEELKFLAERAKQYEPLVKKFLGKGVLFS